MCVDESRSGSAFFFGLLYLHYLPVPSDVPPEETLYQFIVPALAVAASVTLPASHLPFEVVVVMAGELLMTASTIVLEEVQLAVDAAT